MGVVLGTYLGTGTAGWSTFSSPSHIYYVSATGNNSTAVVDDINHPWLTTYAAYLAALAGGGTNPWILCKQGDTFTDQGFGDDRASDFAINGVVNNPAVVGSYHPSFPGVVNPQTGVARPIIQVPVDGICFSMGQPYTGGNWLAGVGLDFYNYTADPNGAGYSQGLTSASVVNGGSGYAVGDLISVTGSNGTTFQAAVFKVESISGSAVATANISVSAGAGFNNEYGRFSISSPPSAFTSTVVPGHGSGSGATFNTPVYNLGGNNAGIAWGAKTTWGLVEDCMFRFFGFGAILNTSGLRQSNSNILFRRSQFYRNSAQGIEGSGSPFTFEECIIHDSCWNQRSAFGIHNIYTDGSRRFGDNLLTDRPIIGRGNLIGLGSTAGNLFRTGCLLDNCTFIAVGDVVAFGNVGTSNPADARTTCLYSSSFTNNIWTESEHVTAGGISGVGGQDDNYKGMVRNLGTTTVTGNLFINSTTIDSGYGIKADHMNGWTVQNNIIYKYGASGQEITTTASTGPTRNSILDVTISNAGTVYSTTGKTTNISAASREDLTSVQGLNTNYVILTVGSTANINATDVGLSSIWISGLTGGSGGFDAAINGKLWLCAVNDSTHIVLLNSDSVPGSYGSGGTVYIPYYNNALNATSGTGTNAICDIIVGPSLNVVAVYFGGSAGPFFESPGSYGQGFVVGDTLNSTTFNAAAHSGTDGGFQLTVAHICSNTIDGTNVLKGGSAATPLGTWPHPERGAGTYYNYLFGGSGATYASLLGSPTTANSILNNNKSNWNDNLTANALNIYIRAGFGIGSDTPPPQVLMPQICL